ncbi:TetR/AcrR family transcriptional regulator [Rhodococcus sp. HNM0569]|uniref:TetR/AcrR family transcriptional regulator n=1 Tax=Rhodococcus sp. HNM0569 TaxID=2716340 RepID=UPI00146A22A8|nr:TetR/AcrR family transcriptional regulator [Rhodococcus sp. HNM0569]NLU83475.1 TetR/AcrR family transcriptional regulator [Rhodococcus sp. HNM0569]
MPRQQRSSRRGLICEAALDLAAEGGNHALTHQAIDTRLALPRGSTSYYYRTRHALVSAAVTHLTRTSAERFAATVPSQPPASADEAAHFIAGYLEALFAERRRDLLARYALVTDAAKDDELRVRLGACLFSPTPACELMDALGSSTPELAAHDLIGLLEGLVFQYTAGSRGSEPPSSGALQATIALWLAALTRSDG